MALLREMDLCRSWRFWPERSRCAAGNIMNKSTAVTIKDLRHHGLEVCKKHGITIYAWCRRPSRCHALTDRDEIRIVPIKSRVAYASALHEIGHLRGRHQRGSSTLMRERWAWEWVRANAADLDTDHREQRPQSHGMVRMAGRRD